LNKPISQRKTDHPNETDKIKNQNKSGLIVLISTMRVHC
jgi:hypothetical protein